MKQRAFRLSDALVAKLLAQAQARNLTFSAHVRSQLEAAAHRPHDILKTSAEAGR